MLRSARAGPGVSREKRLHHLARQTWVPPTLKLGGAGGASLSTTTTRLPSPPPMSSAGWCKVLSIYRLRCSLGQFFPARRAQELLLGPIQRPCLEAVATPRVASRRPSQVLVRCHFGPSTLSSPRIPSACLCAALLPPRPSNPRTAQVVRGALQAIDAPRLPPSSESSRPAGIAGRPLCKLNPRVPRNAH